MSSRLERSFNDSSPSFINPRSSDLKLRTNQEQRNLLDLRNGEEMLEEPQAEPEQYSRTRALVEGYKLEDNKSNDNQKPFVKSMMPSEFGQQFTAPYKRQNSNASEDEDEDTEVEESRCIMRQESRGRISWDISVIILALWNVFFIPLNIAFKPPFGNFVLIMTFNYLIDCLFFVDIVLNFRTTYLDSDGDQIFLPKMIAVHYIKSGRLFIDLLASIPLDSIPGLTFLQFLGLLKLMRIFRVPKLIQKVSLTETAKTSIKVLEVIILLIILYHITACIWFIVVSGTNEWIPPVNWIDTNTLKRAFYQRHRTTLQEQYLVSLYYGVMGLNSGEIGPRSEASLITASLIMFSGMFINALLFGTMAELILQLKRKERQVQESLDNANTAMMNLKLPMRNQREVVQYLMTIQSTQAQQEELKEFENLLSPNLKRDVRLYIFYTMIVDNTVFKKLIAHPEIDEEDFVFESVKRLDIQLSEPQNLIFNYNAPSDAIYFIAKGAVVVQNKEMVNRQNERLKQLKKSSHFGEIGVIYNCPRTMRVVGDKYSTLAKLSRQKMIDMSQVYSTMVTQFKKYIKTYKDPVKVTLEKVLERVPLFKHLGDFDIYKIIFSFQMISVASKDVLFEYGGKQEGMYVILDGYGTLSIRTEGIYIPIKLLKKGHIYGVDSLIAPGIHRLSLMCMNYKMMPAKIKKKDRHGNPISNEQLFDETGNKVHNDGSIFHKFNDSSPHQSRKVSSTRFVNQNVERRSKNMQKIPGLDQIEEEELSPDQERHRVDRSSQINFSPRIQQKSSMLGNGSTSVLLNSMEGGSPPSQPSRKGSLYYTKKEVNTAVAFLPNQSFQKLLESIPQLRVNVDTELKNIEKSTIRPYIMDYFIPKKMPKKEKNFMKKLRFITEQQGGRNALFKVKNAIFHKLFSNRLVKKSQTIIERVFCQLHKEDSEHNNSYLDLSQNIERSRSMLLPPGFKFGRSMTEETKIQTFVNETHDMHCKAVQCLAKVNMVLGKMDEMNKRFQRVKNGFDYNQKVVLEVLNISPQQFKEAYEVQNAPSHLSSKQPDVINEVEEILSKEKSIGSGVFEIRKPVQQKKDDEIESQPPQQ